MILDKLFLDASQVVRKKVANAAERQGVSDAGKLAAEVLGKETYVPSTKVGPAHGLFTRIAAFESAVEVQLAGFDKGSTRVAAAEFKIGRPLVDGGSTTAMTYWLPDAPSSGRPLQALLGKDGNVYVQVTEILDRDIPKFGKVGTYTREGGLDIQWNEGVSLSADFGLLDPHHQGGATLNIDMPALPPAEAKMPEFFVLPRATR